MSPDNIKVLINVQAEAFQCTVEILKNETIEKLK